MPAGSGTVDDQSEPVRSKQRGTRILVVSILVAMAVLLTAFSAFVYYGSQDDDDEDATDDIVISDEVRLPEEDSSVVEVQVESDSITYIYDALPEELNYSVGDVIVGTTDLGYLRRVTAIEQDGNTVTVQTENATLEDAIRNGTLAFTADLVDSSAQGLSCADLCKASVLSDDYELFGIDIPVNETCYVGEVEVRLYGEVNLSISLSLEVDFDIFTGLHRVYFAVNTYTYFEFHFIASSEATFSEEWVVYSHWFPTYVVYVGSLPVTLTPQIEFIVNATGGMSSSLTAGVNGTVTTTLGMEYSGGYWSTVQDYTRDVEYEPPVLEGSASLRLNTSTPRLTLWVYGMVGPYVSLWPWASFDAEGQAGLDEIALSWNLDAGLKGKAGVRVEVLSVSLVDYSVDLFGYTWNIASGDVLLTAPSPPLSLVGIPGDGLVTLSWEPPLSDGGLAITEYRVLRGSSSGSGEFLASTGLSTMYADGDVVNGVAYYYVVTVRNGLWESETSEEVAVTPTSAPLPPSAPVGLAATQEGPSVSLTWEPPLSEGSSPITGYNLYRNGSVLAELDATTSFVDDAVVAGCTYTYQVSALNDVGESLLSNEVVIVVEEVASFSEDFEAYSSVADVGFEMVWTKHVVGYPSGADSAKIETLPSGNKALWGSATNVPSKAFSQIYDARGVYAEDFVMEFDLANMTYTGTGSYLVFVVGMDFRASENTCYRFAFVYSFEMGGAKEFLYKMPSGRQWENVTEVLAETSWHAYSLPDSHHVKVVCSGPEISAYLDSGPDPILSATDASFVGGFIGTYLEAGDGGTGQFTGSRHVDNITLDLMEVAVVQYCSDVKSLEPAEQVLLLPLEQPDCSVGLVDDSLASALRCQPLKSDGCRANWAARPN